MFRFPRERGLLSLWLATLLYALLVADSFNLWLCLSLLGSIVLLLLADYMLDSLRALNLHAFARGFVIISTVYAPIVYKSSWLFSPLALAITVMLSLLLLFAKMKVRCAFTLVGACLVATHSLMILLASGSLLFETGVYPILYVAMSTIQASNRVVGCGRAGQAVFYTLVLLAFLYGIVVFYPRGALLALAIVLADIMSRLVQEATGLSRRLTIRAYGFTEMFRSITVLTALGATLKRVLESTNLPA